MFNPIGTIKNSQMEKIDQNWGEIESEIVINKELQDGLLGLEQFSHIVVVFHLDQAHFVKEKHLVRRQRDREDLPMMGIFAQRSKDRPNAIGLSTVKLLSIQENIVKVKGLDAINGTPVLDIKPYYPAHDTPTNATVPEWVEELMKGYY